MNSKVVIVTEYFYPDSRNDAMLLTDIAECLSKINNDNIHVVCTSKLKDAKELDFINNKIDRLENSRLDKDNIFFRVFRLILLTMKLIGRANRIIATNDRVFSTTNPVFLLPLLVLLKKIKKFEYTLLVYDVFPENLVAAKIIKKNRLLYRFVKYIYDRAYSNVDHLVVIGRDMKEVMRKKVNNNTEITVIENWCDFKAVTPREKQNTAIIQNLQLQNKKIFTFTGNFGRVQGINNLLRASELVEDVDFRLLFIGDGALKKDILAHINNTDKNNVIYAGSFPSSMSNEFLNACDVSIVSLSDSMYGLGVPSKSYYNMAAAKPLLYIGDKNSEIALLIMEHNIGWIAKPEQPEILAKLLDDICINFQMNTSIGLRSRAVVENFYSKDVIFEKYSKLFKSLTQSECNLDTKKGTICSM
jgi:glycosyltransferase involved in cell wall biosynthesis